MKGSRQINLVDGVGEVTMYLYMHSPTYVNRLGLASSVRRLWSQTVVSYGLINIHINGLISSVTYRKCDNIIIGNTFFCRSVFCYICVCAFVM